MLGRVNLQSASKDPRAPLWLRKLHQYTEWKNVVIEPLDAQRLQAVLLKRPRKTVVMVNLRSYKGMSKLVTYHGVFLGVPRIRSIYLLRYVSR